ncbi:hypothetical protein SIO70_24900 [Chitinophaga sancti]|uniref:hypothetical protein n=1 Tax=Chitinophaga sancti TaxID=1004 RepID=UPI002A75EB2A|nr:hypothetical protein [Chitinophaga sancti]WPQ61604.1 hypothetical protein SIO70_24900 [Chitinophaga sancti]
MNYQYFTTFCFLNKKTEITKESISSRKVYYRFYFDPEILTEVGERYLNGKFDQVFYKEGNIELIKKHHRAIFPENPDFNIIQCLTEFTILLKIYKHEIFSGAEIFNYNNNYEQIENLIFDNTFQLQEFNSTLKENGILKKKIFLAYDWRILEDY